MKIKFGTFGTGCLVRYKANRFDIVAPLVYTDVIFEIHSQCHPEPNTQERRRCMLHRSPAVMGARSSAGATENRYTQQWFYSVSRYSC